MNFSHFEPTAAVQCLMGLILLCLGRKLFWLFVGVIGFFAGAHFGQHLAAGQPQTMILLIAIGLGLLGAILAIFLQRLAIAIAGGVAGGMLAIRLAALFGLTTQPLELAAFVVGAIVAAILISVLFDWALILLSSLTGAVMVVEPFGLAQSAELIVFAVLALVGILVQARSLEPRVRSE